MKYREIEGDLIALAKEGKFDVITHGCNCFCTMGSGIAVPMRQTFRVDTYKKEHLKFKGDLNKLGTIDYGIYILENKSGAPKKHYHSSEITKSLLGSNNKILHVVNSYTQFNFNRFVGIPDLDYSALKLCFKKINYKFKGMKIGIPLIGCGLAGGNWLSVKSIIQDTLIDMDVTIVFFGINPDRQLMLTSGITEENFSKLSLTEKFLLKQSIDKVL